MLRLGWACERSAARSDKTGLCHREGQLVGNDTGKSREACDGGVVEGSQRSTVTSMRLGMIAMVRGQRLISAMALAAVIWHRLANGSPCLLRWQTLFAVKEMHVNAGIVREPAASLPVARRRKRRQERSCSCPLHSVSGQRPASLANAAFATSEVLQAHRYNDYIFGGETWIQHMLS